MLVQTGMIKSVCSEKRMHANYYQISKALKVITTESWLVTGIHNYKLLTFSLIE